MCFSCTFPIPLCSLVPSFRSCFTPVFRSLDRPILLPCSQIICASLRSWIRNRAIGQKLQVSVAMVFALRSCRNRLPATQRVYVFVLRPNERKGLFSFSRENINYIARLSIRWRSRVESVVDPRMFTDRIKRAGVGWMIVAAGAIETGACVASIDAAI